MCNRRKVTADTCTQSADSRIIHAMSYKTAGGLNEEKKEVLVADENYCSSILVLSSAMCWDCGLVDKLT